MATTKQLGRHRGCKPVGLQFTGSATFHYGGQQGGSNAGGSSSLLLAGVASVLLASSTDTYSDSISSDMLPDVATVDKLPVYRRAEIMKHNSREVGVWVTYKEGVYDVTDFIANHPGGEEKLILAAGMDLSEFWKMQKFKFHFQSPLALELLSGLRIGSVHPDDIIITSEVESNPLVYSNRVIYDCIVIGSGVSGLQCAHSLITDHGVPTENVLVLEANDYVGGRVRQMSDFIKGVHVDVGAEFLHGQSTLLTKFAEEQNQPIEEIFCWAHGDGGPLEKPVGKGFGLYWIKDEQTGKKRLLRFDDKDPDFVKMNETLWGLADLKEDDYSDMHSLQDYLSGPGFQFSQEMINMAAGGFANTLCTNSHDLSLKQCIKWCRLWNAEEGGEGDYMFKHSFKVLVDHLQKNLQIQTGSPVTYIQHPQGGASGVDTTGGLVKVRTSTGVEYYAKSLVITSSPHVLNSGVMEFQPPLSEELKRSLDTVNMHNIVKVFLKFSEPVWPEGLHGMIMTDDSFLLPEIWFRDVSDSVAANEPAKAYCIGFTTADYAARLSSMPKDEVLRKTVGQLDEVFSHLEDRHMAANVASRSGDNTDAVAKDGTVKKPSQLRKPSEAFVGGMFWDWNPDHHPFIGGGYCSPKAKKAAYLIERLSKPYNNQICFAGEATNLPGATAHAALESGVRAAGYVASRLQTDKEK